MECVDRHNLCPYRHMLSLFFLFRTEFDGLFIYKFVIIPVSDPTYSINPVMDAPADMDSGHGTVTFGSRSTNKLVYVDRGAVCLSSRRNVNASFRPFYAFIVIHRFGFYLVVFPFAPLLDVDHLLMRHTCDYWLASFS